MAKTDSVYMHADSLIAIARIGPGGRVVESPTRKAAKAKERIAIPFKPDVHARSDKKTILVIFGFNT
jgi:hypothetical protein